MDISKLRQSLERNKGKRDQISQDLILAKSKEKYWKNEIKTSEDAKIIINLIAQKTQKKLEYRLCELVTLAMNSIFEDPYELKVDFVPRRGKTECDISFSKNQKPYNPFSSGGGTVNVACFALIIAVFSLSRPKTRNFLLLDEPFARLKGEEPNKRAIQVVKEISDEVGVQIIMVSDERSPMEEIKRGADKVFRVYKKGDRSIVDISKG